MAPVRGLGSSSSANAEACEMRHPVFQRLLRDQAENPRSRARRCGLGLEFAPTDMQVDLLPDRRRERAALRRRSRAPCPRPSVVEAPRRRFKIGDGQHEMVDAVDFHANLSLAAGNRIFRRREIIVSHFCHRGSRWQNCRKNDGPSRQLPVKCAQIFRGGTRTP